MKRKLVVVVRIFCLCGLVAAGCLSVIGTGGGGGGGIKDLYQSDIVGTWLVYGDCIDTKVVFSGDGSYGTDDFVNDRCPDFTDWDNKLKTEYGVWDIVNGLFYKVISWTDDQEDQDKIDEESEYRYYVFASGQDTKLVFLNTAGGFTPTSTVDGLVNTWTRTNDDNCSETLTFNNDGTFSDVAVCDDETGNWDVSGTYTDNNPWVEETYTSNEEVETRRVYYQIIDSELFCAYEDEIMTKLKE